MEAAAANRRSVELSAARRGRSRGLTSDHRGTRRAVMVEFYTTVGVTGSAPRVARLTECVASGHATQHERPQSETDQVSDRARWPGGSHDSRTACGRRARAAGAGNHGPHVGTVPPVAGRARSPIIRVLPGLMLVMLIGALDQTIMAPALPAVAGDLGRLNQIPAVVTAYLAAATVVMPAASLLPVRIPLRMRPAVMIWTPASTSMAAMCSSPRCLQILSTAAQLGRPTHRCARPRSATGVWADRGPYLRSQPAPLLESHLPSPARRSQQ